MHLGLIIGKGSYTSYSALTLSFKVQGGKSLELNPDYRVYRNIQGKKKKKKKKKRFFNCFGLTFCSYYVLLQDPASPASCYDLNCPALNSRTSPYSMLCYDISWGVLRARRTSSYT